MRVLASLVLAIMISGCGLLPPPPTAIDCGPLSSDPAACESAVHAALELMALQNDDVAAVRIEAPAQVAGCKGHTCIGPEIIVLAYRRGSVDPDKVPLVSGEGGWINAAVLR